MSEHDPSDEFRASALAWAACGAMSLTGAPDGPGLGPPEHLVPRLASFARRFGDLAGRLGRPVELDPLTLLTERAAVAGTTRRGRTSCGGGSRLLRSEDAWVAVSLPRTDDHDLVPAWLEIDAPPRPGHLWETVEHHVARAGSDTLVSRAAMLGLAVSAVPADGQSEESAPTTDLPSPGGEAPEAHGRVRPWRSEHLAPGARTASLEGVVVADLGSLWAGPLCGALLAQAGATVVKVESTTRPDGARRGPPEFFDLLNSAKLSVALDLSTTAGWDRLAQLLASVDVVVEASRPRALEQMGIQAAELLRTARPRVWVSITAHGRTGRGRERIGFGDDVAAGAGLVARHGGEPTFCADAVADPATGLVAATAALDALDRGESTLVDVPMSSVAAELGGRTLEVPDAVTASPPARRPSRGAAPALGEHTDAVLDSIAGRT